MASGSRLSVWRLADSQLSRHSKRGRGWKRVEQTRLPLELNGYNATRFLKAPPFQCLKVCVCVFLLVQDSRAWTACCSAGLWKRGVATKSGQQPRSLAFKSWTTDRGEISAAFCSTEMQCQTLLPMFLYPAALGRMFGKLGQPFIYYINYIYIYNYIILYKYI